MFYLIGLGLGDAKDITVKGLEIIKKCHRVYLESYTSILTCGITALEAFYGRSLIIAYRESVEQGADEILLNADTENVAFLVVGDPFGATTHTDIILRAQEKGIPFEVVHNASILNAAGCCGLHLYNFGATVSIPLWTETWKPESFFDKILLNYNNQMHTLCLLDIKVREPTLESLTKKVKEYMPPKFMSVGEACTQILEVKQKRTVDNVLVTEDSLCVALARVGAKDQRIRFCTIKEMLNVDLGGPLHSLIIPSKDLHPLELEYLEKFK